MDSRCFRSGFPRHPDESLSCVVGEVGLEPTKADAKGFTVPPLCHSGHSPARGLKAFFLGGSAFRNARKSVGPQIGARLIVSSPKQRNDRKSGFRPHLDKGGKARAPRVSGADAKDWLWGVHAVEAALDNPNRATPRRLLATADRAQALTRRFGPLKTLETAEAAEIARVLPAGAVHQGLALKIDPLEPLSITEIGSPAEGVLILLDQITDPQNVGAIFRSAAAFGARGVILQDRHAPALGGALAKAAVVKTDDKTLAVAPVSNLAYGSATLATPPANLLTVRETELSGKDLIVQMNAATAKKAGVAEGAKVKLSAGKGELKARVHLNEGVAPGTVAVLLGFGRSAWDEYTKGKGDNVYKILTVSDEAGTGLKVWAGSTVTVAKV